MFVEKITIGAAGILLDIRGKRLPYEKGGPELRDRLASLILDFEKRELAFLHDIPILSGNGEVMEKSLQTLLLKACKAKRAAPGIDPHRDYLCSLDFAAELSRLIAGIYAGSVLTGKPARLKGPVKELAERAEACYRQVEGCLDQVTLVNAADRTAIPGVIAVYKRSTDSSALVDEGDYDNKGHLMCGDRYTWIPESKCPFSRLTSGDIPEKYLAKARAMEHTHPRFGYRDYNGMPDTEDARKEAEGYFSQFSSASQAVMALDLDGERYHRAAHLYLDDVIVGYRMDGYKIILWYCPRED